jgi:hypothetical protein
VQRKLIYIRITEKNQSGVISVMCNGGEKTSHLPLPDHLTPKAPFVEVWSRARAVSFTAQTVEEKLVNCRAW